MSELIKKKWWVILAGLALLILLTFLWPNQPAQQTTPPTPQNKTVEREKPDQKVPSTLQKQLPVVVESDPVVAEVNSEKVEEENVVPEEEESEPPSKNFILCEHIISGESQYEFFGEIRLINKGSKPVYGWSVNWEYEDGSTIVDASGVALSGSNPYTGQYLSENAEIPPGKTVTFSFTGIKNGDSAPKRVDVTGDLCM